MDLSKPPVSPSDAPLPLHHSGLGIVSSLFAAAAGGLLLVSLRMLVKAAFSATQSVTVKGAITLVSVFGMGLSGIILAFGFGLGVAGIMQRGRKPMFAITGTVVNSSLLMTLLILSAVGWAAAKNGTQAKLAAASAANAAALPAPPTAAPRQPAHADEIERRGSAAALAGYERVLVADLAADPARYASRKVALSGFYAGTQVDSFIIFGKWGGGGTVAVDGTKLPAENQKALLLSLDGFHKVFVRGVFKPHAVSKASPLRSFGLMLPSYKLFADDVVDLGKVDDPMSDR